MTGLLSEIPNIQYQANNESEFSCNLIDDHMQFWPRNSFVVRIVLKANERRLNEGDGG